MTTEASNPDIEIKDLYKLLVDTRNLEINLFWQRSNYFLALNSGIAFAFFNLNDSKVPYALVFAVFGLFTSLLWFWVCLGGKFWQARWEHRLQVFEKTHFPHLEFFAATPVKIKRDAVQGLAFFRLSGLQRVFYRMALRKPSVSYSMIRLSALFVLAWAAFITIRILLKHTPT